MTLRFTHNLDDLRQIMIERHIIARGVCDPLVIRAMRTVPRESFVPPEMTDLAYEDYPLPIGEDQTISQPYIVAFMTEALELTVTDKVLEIGTGSGYAAAVVGSIAATVHTVERIESLARRARQRLEMLGYTNFHVHEGDGTLGWSEHAPTMPSSSPPVPPGYLLPSGISLRLVAGLSSRSGRPHTFRRSSGCAGSVTMNTARKSFAASASSPSSARRDGNHREEV